MSIILRLLLFVGAVAILLYFSFQVRKKRLQIDYAIFWILFCFLMVIIAIFPGIVITLSALLGFESPANFVFLIVIFLLIIKLFSTNAKLSKLNQQVNDLTQSLSIHKKDIDD